MKIIVQNNADLPNKHIRLLKWKIYRIKRKFNHLLYAEVYISKEGTSPQKYRAVVKLGIPGNDIMLIHRSESLAEVWRASYKDAKRYLRKRKEKAHKRLITASKYAIS